MKILDLRMRQAEEWAATLVDRDEALDLVKRALDIAGLDVEIIREDGYGDVLAVVSNRAAPDEHVHLNHSERVAYERALGGTRHEATTSVGRVTYGPIVGASGRVVGAVRIVWRTP